MTSAYAGPHEARRHYYKCSHNCRSRGPQVTTGSYVPVGIVEAQAEPLILARLDELREELGREPERRPVRMGADFATRKAKLQRKRERYLEAFADEHMTRDELGTAMSKLDKEALRIDGEEHAAKRTSPLADATVRRAKLREVGAIAKAWSRATPEERRSIVGHLVTKVAIEAGKVPRFVWRSAEELAAPTA